MVVNEEAFSRSTSTFKKESQIKSVEIQINKSNRPATYVDLF